jgi:hypothetical protein
LYSVDASRAATRANLSRGARTVIEVTQETTIIAGERLHAKLGQFEEIL